jgi:predicted DNA-binding WGR domain protein
MAVKENAMLIFTDAKENNNKFYELILNDDDSVDTRWGRVGAEGQKKTVYGGKYEFDRILRSKTSKGYVLSKTVGINISSGGQNKMALAETAKRDLVKADVATDKNASVLIKLVERLSEMNRHQIMSASNGNIKIDETGLITTPLGLVTASTIGEARTYLNKIEKYCNSKKFDSNDYIGHLEEYGILLNQSSLFDKCSTPIVNRNILINKNAIWMNDKILTIHTGAIQKRISESFLIASED